MATPHEDVKLDDTRLTQSAAPGEAADQPLVVQSISELIDQEMAQAREAEVPASSSLTPSQVERGIATLRPTKWTRLLKINFEDPTIKRVHEASATPARHVLPSLTSKDIEEGEVDENEQCEEQELGQVMNSSRRTENMRVGSNQADASPLSRQSLPLAYPAVNRGGEGSGFVSIKDFGRSCDQLGPEYVPAYSCVSKEPFKSIPSPLEPPSANKHLLDDLTKEHDCAMSALHAFTERKGWAQPFYATKQDAQSGWGAKVLVNGWTFTAPSRDWSAKEAKEMAAEIAFAYFFGTPFAVPRQTQKATSRPHPPLYTTSGNSIITELNNYTQKKHMQLPRYMIRISSGGFYGGEMVVNKRHFSTPFQHSVGVEAKADLAARGYRFLTGIDLGSADPLPASGPRTTPSSMNTPTKAKTMPPPTSTSSARASPDAGLNSQQMEVGMRRPHAMVPPLGPARQVPSGSENSYSSKLARLAIYHRMGSSVQYDIHQDYEGRGWGGRVIIEAHDFRAPRFFNSAASVKEMVAEKAYLFWSRALTTRAMVPVLGFGALARALRMLDNQADISISGDAELTVNAKDEYGALIVSHKLRTRACAKLSHTLQAQYHQNPQWYERQGRTSKGEPMYACLLHWANGKEIFGDICQGYPDAKLARMMAAIPAIEWLEEHPKHKQRIPHALAASLGPVSLGRLQPVVKNEPRTDLALPRQPVPVSDRSEGHYSSDYDFARADQYPPNKIDKWRPTGPAVPVNNLIDSWRPAASGGKRHADYGLSKENEPFRKRMKADGGGSIHGSAFLSNTSDELDYGRVEHVDGRYGFGP